MNLGKTVRTAGPYLILTVGTIAASLALAIGWISADEPKTPENYLESKQETAQTVERSANVFPNSPGAEGYLLSVFAFHDFNGNGKPDRGELPIKGIRISTAGLSGVTGADGMCELGYLPEGTYDLVVQDPSGKFRYVLPSLSEVIPIGDGLEIAVDRDTEVLVPLGEGFLTLPIRRGVRYDIGNFVDVGDVFNHTFMRDWRNQRSTYPGHQGIDFDISDKTVVAAVPGIIIGAQRRLREIGTRVVIYHPNSGVSPDNFFLTEYNDMKRFHKSIRPLPFNYDRFKADPWDYVNRLDLEKLQRVKRGNIIGYTGYLGQPLQVRLHFESWTTDPRHTKGEPVRIMDPYLASFKDSCRECIFANHLHSLWTVENSPQYPSLPKSPKQQANYLFGILKKHNYSQLERQLRRYVPELRKIDTEDIEPLDDIVALAVTATNPEVREAFDLMIKGGRRGFGPNTELQVLFWLAEQNEFKKDDTLAMAIAMVNGLWVAIGTDDGVKQAVYKHVNDLLNFFRETNEIQKVKGYYCLEDYPLEAKVVLGWNGGLNMHWVGPASQPKIRTRLVYYKNRKLPLTVYEKATVSVETMQKMRKIADDEGWWVKDVNTSIKNIEDYFYTYPRLTHWQFASFPTLILDENGLDAWLDMDWQFNRYSEGLKPKGDCGTETSFVDAWAKSMGTATTLHWMYKRGESCGSANWYSHSYAIFFVPQSEVWTAYKRQVQNLVPPDASSKDYLLDYFIYKPPVNQKGYLRYNVKFTPTFHLYENSAYTIRKVKLKDTQRMIMEGIPTAQMKKWLFSR